HRARASAPARPDGLVPADGVGIAAQLVGLGDAQVFAAVELDLIDGHVAEIGDVLDHAVHAVGAARGDVVARALARQADLLRTNGPPEDLVGRTLDAVVDVDVGAKLLLAAALVIVLVVGDDAHDHVHRADEAGDEPGIADLVDLGRLADHGALALVHDAEAGRKAHRLFRIVGDDDEG